VDKDTSVSLPESVKISGYTFKFSVLDRIQANADNVYGRFSSQTLIIEIDTSVPSFHVLDSFIHEITHAIYWCYNLRDGDSEEKVVSLIARGWQQVYRDNPDVLKFISDNLK